MIESYRQCDLQLPGESAALRRVGCAKLGGLSCRINVKGGGTRLIPLPSKEEWTFSDDADIAVLLFEGDDDLDVNEIPDAMLMEDEKSRFDGIGIGDELFIMGLFTQRSRDEYSDCFEPSIEHFLLSRVRIDHSSRSTFKLSIELL